MADDAARRAYVAQHVSADLIYVWEEMGLSLLHQRELAERYRSVALFSSIADTRADARAALRAEVTVADNPDGRAAVAALVAAWQTCYDMADQERRLKAEAHVLGLPKPLPSNDRMGMRHALEKVVGALEEKDEPSSTYLALKLEEVEAGELRAAVLDEVTSISDEVNAQFQSSVDSSGRLRLVKERKKAKLPATSEELRQRLRLECYTFLMLAARFRTKPWFVDLRVQDYAKHVDFVLGDKVYLLQMSRTDGATGTQAVNPSWTLLLNFEHRLRKEAYKRACRENRDIATTLAEVRGDASLKETYFVGPLALELASRSSSSAAPPPPSKWPRLQDHVPGADAGHKGGGGKGRGKGGKGSLRLGFPSARGFVFSSTPDGRQICYAYNNGTCKGDCGRVHVCQLCLKPHPRKSCKMQKDKASGGGDGQKN